jgi:glycosyltransferase involved in cell wall biosynthesis
VKRIAIDLTPMLPGGDNGGIKPLALELVRRLAAARPECELVLLTNEKSDAELAALIAPDTAPNVRRLCVSRPENAPAISRRRALQLRAMLLRVLPESTVRKLGEWYMRRAAVPQSPTPLLRQIAADLLFCPFTGVFFFDPAVPVVCVVADLQYLYYPQFFSPEVRHERDRHFRHVCRVASRLVCISEYTRSTVLQQSDVPLERTAVVWIAAHERFIRPDRAAADGVLARLALQRGEFLLYPANFWRHKNHEMLLIAFGMYRTAHPQSRLKLALTGAPSARRDELMEAARRMGLAEHVLFAGFLPDLELAALLENCAAMIFPSLFEGFGMPVLEAMAASVPVLCSNLTSLPEIAGPQGRPAALQFDPRRPAAIAEAIERLESDPALRPSLIERGRQWAQSLPGAAAMVARYWEIFEDAVKHPLERAAAVHGVFPDGWTGERITVVYGPDRRHGSGERSTPRRLTVTLLAPEWLPSRAISLQVSALRTPSETHRIPRGQRKTIALDLPGQAGAIELLCSPTFRPGGEDHRELGCMLEAASIEGTPLPREVHAA